MKNSKLFFCFWIVMLCQQTDDLKAQDNLQTEKTFSKFVMRIDTMVIYDPETNMESIKIAQNWTVKTISNECFPSISYQGRKTGMLTTEQLTKNQQLELQNMPGCSDNWKLSAYQIALLDGKQEVLVMDNYGIGFGSQTEELLKKIKPGHTIKFQNILLLTNRAEMAAGNTLEFSIK